MDRIPGWRLLLRSRNSAYCDAMAGAVRCITRDHPSNPTKPRDVLVKGLHRFEALKALGEETIQALIVRTGNV